MSRAMSREISWRTGWVLWESACARWHVCGLVGPPAQAGSADRRAGASCRASAPARRTTRTSTPRLQAERHQPLLPAQAGRDLSTPASRTASRALDLVVASRAHQGGRRRQDPRRRGPALPGQRPGGTHQRLLRAGPLRQRLVLRRGHGRARPARARRQHRGLASTPASTAPSPASSCRRAPSSAAGSARSGSPGRPRTFQGRSTARRRSPCRSARSATPCAPRRRPRSSRESSTTSTTSRASARSSRARSSGPTETAAAGRDPLLSARFCLRLSAREPGCRCEFWWSRTSRAWRRSCQRGLEESGLASTWSARRQEALLAGTARTTTTPIVLDVVLPDLDGFEVRPAAAGGRPLGAGPDAHGA